MNDSVTIDESESDRLADATPGATASFTGTQDGVRLSVTVDASSARLIVREARHEGATDAVTNRVLDKLCTLIVGRPLQEAADHGAIYAAAALPADCAPVAGIRTPRNAGPAFALAERLMRAVHAGARERFNVGHRENAWYVRPKADWLSMDEIAKANSIKPIIGRFLRDKGLAEGDIFINRIERGTRITISFGEGIGYSAKPKLMMELEHQLRHETGDPLELFMEEMKDANKIRRL